MSVTETFDPALMREWLCTNGVGGYASGTVAGVITRRYHGLLTAALPNPLGRVVMLNYLGESVIFPDSEEVQLAGEELRGCALQLRGACYLTAFRLELGLPVWRYEMKGYVLEKRLFMRYQQNTVQVDYRLLAGREKLRLRLRPAVHFRSHQLPVNMPLDEVYALTISGDDYTISASRNQLNLRMELSGVPGNFVVDRKNTDELVYRSEESRGYEFQGRLWTPGYFDMELGPGEETSFIGSTEEWTIMRGLQPREAFEAELERRKLLLGRTSAAKGDIQKALVLAADQFLIVPVSRWTDLVKINVTGDVARSVIAGYHWFTDWGRDTMISLEGLTLVTGRYSEAGWILRTFSRYVRDGLIPNMFPETANEGRYNTADATLWMFHALDRYLTVTGDRATLRLMLPRLKEIIEHHQRGTRFGIHVDPADGLLRQGEEGYALTWMDAKVGDLVITPRRGKAVEINALWYNALKLMEEWLDMEEDGALAREIGEQAEKVRESFNRRFWSERDSYLFDVVDGEKGDDACFRPNQVFAISLPHAVLDSSHWVPVMELVTERLLTPYGLRTLAPGSPGYKTRYGGDICARDAAYHQGTVWPWLIGPFIDAWIKVYPERRAEARGFLETLMVHFQEQACVGSISEVFDAEEPYNPGGCIAQAWSVAEVLRAWLRTAPELRGVDFEAEQILRGHRHLDLP